jgi:hypothetical protein
LISVVLFGFAYGGPIIFNTNPLNVYTYRGLSRGYITARPVTALNTFAVPPRNLVPPAPAMPVRVIPRVYETSSIPQRYTATKILKPITVLPLAITTVPTFTNIPRNGAASNSQYNYSYGVSDPRTGAYHFSSLQFFH